MRKILLSLVLTLFMTVNGFAEMINITCLSESGMSKYTLKLDTKVKALVGYNGEIRYEFMGQDVLYNAYIEKQEEDYIEGIAVFLESNSGETKGNPFNFSYNLKTKVFTELNQKSSCN